MALAIALSEVFVALFALLVGIYYFKNKKDPRYPPGPRALPFVGNLLQLGKNPLPVFSKWVKQYGSVFSIKMGTDDMVIVSDLELIKEIFAANVGSGRSQNPLFVVFGGGNYGIINTEGFHWEAQRRFTLRTLRDFGFAKSAMEGLILEEVNSVLNWLRKQNGKSFTGNRIFAGAVGNVLWNIISGERNDWDTPNPPEVLTNVEELLGALNNANSKGLVFAPSLRHVAPDFFGWTRWVKSIEKVAKYTNKTILEHVAKLNPNSPKDFIDHYLLEIEKTKDENSSFYKETGEKNMGAIILDLFAAGSETTSSTLASGLLYLSRHLEVQKKIQEELDRVIAPGHQPSNAEKHSLPYTEAVIAEILRLSNIFPFGVLHRALGDTTLNGFFIPKGTTIMSNLYEVLHNSDLWEDPLDFKPERFLSKDGTKVVKPDAYIPFSVGKRQCPGEVLAKDQLFLFYTCILQEFCIIPDPDSPQKPITFEPGFLRTAMTFKICAIPREKTT